MELSKITSGWNAYILVVFELLARREGEKKLYSSMYAAKHCLEYRLHSYGSEGGNYRLLVRRVSYRVYAFGMEYWRQNIV